VVSQPGYLFAGTFGGGVYRSTDGGQTWMAPLTGGNLAITAMVVNDPYIFAGSIEEGVYRSSDNGATWIQKLSVFGIGPMCISGNTIFASTSNYTYGSTDNGETWFNVSAHPRRRAQQDLQIH
jgi:lipid-binding SYLF domain-containing protein